MQFPKQHPEMASYPKPRDGESLPLSPPGFCWWRIVDEEGKAVRGDAVRYRLTVADPLGNAVYTSPLLADPVHVPTETLTAGKYTWSVEALSESGDTIDTWPESVFEIEEGATLQPWVDAEEILKRVPRTRPRLIFPAAELEQIRGSIDNTRKRAFESLRARAEEALEIVPMDEPTYDQIEDPADRRVQYGVTFSNERNQHENGMRPLALMYLLTGEEKYAAKAKEILLKTCTWEIEGISSVLAPYGDELGLGIAKSAPQTYDWLYDYLTEDERKTVEENLAARADQLLRRLEDRLDFMYRSGSSHDGRLIVFIGEFACCLPDHPRAAVWLDYSLRGMMTVFPHWGGMDGGWNEGIGYGSAYNTLFLPALQSVVQATGVDIWQRPYFRKVRRFFMYCVAPNSEMHPFGDGEQGAIGEWPAPRAMLTFHANKFDDAELAWWLNLFKTPEGETAPIAYLPGIILPETTPPREPENMPDDAVFHGVGWVAMHSAMRQPDRDLFLIFKSSPYGAVSHAYADQNTFGIMKGGKALAIPSGGYYPTYGSPFHFNYTHQTMAKNGILVGGKGQKDRSGESRGCILDFQRTTNMVYTCGEAAAAYDGLLKRFRRHILMVRPSLIVIVDDLEAAEPTEFQWLLHAFEQMQVDEAAQHIVSVRHGHTMATSLYTEGGFGFHQTDEWAVQPKEGYPTTPRPEPEKQWHFTATTRECSTERRIAAVIYVPDHKGTTEASPRIIEENGMLKITTDAGGDHGEVFVALSPEAVRKQPALSAEFKARESGVENIEACLSE